MFVAPFDRGPDIALHIIDDARAVQARDTQEAVTAIQVQGNTATPDEEVRRLAGVSIGMPADAATIEAVAARLRAAKRFERVEVRKRFASIEDPSQIMLVIIVDEGPVKVVMTGDPDRPTRVVKKRLPNILVAPILGYDDGYGFTYGARLTTPDPKWMGTQSHISFPLSWGATKQAGIDLEKRIDGGVFDRITTGASVSRRVNLAFDQNDDRARVYARGEHQFARVLRIGATGEWQRASYEGVADDFPQVTADSILDTRVDPVTARNAKRGVVVASRLRQWSLGARRRTYTGVRDRRPHLARRRGLVSSAAALAGACTEAR